MQMGPIKNLSRRVSPDLDTLGPYDVLQNLVVDSVLLQHSGAIRRDLNASADLCEPRCALENSDIMAFLSEGNGGSKSAQATACDDNLQLHFELFECGVLLMSY